MFRKHSLVVVFLLSLLLSSCARNQQSLLAEPEYLNYTREEILAAGGWKPTKEGLTAAISGKQVVYRRYEDRRNNWYTTQNYYADGRLDKRTCTIRGNSCQMIQARRTWTVNDAGNFASRQTGESFGDVYFVDPTTFVIFLLKNASEGCGFGSRPITSVCTEFHIIGAAQPFE